MKGSGYPLRIPHIDLAEVSSGGGTIAWVDEGGALRIGPLSAGADPGPVCYGRGGAQPTITDANLVLGRLPRVLGGGEIILDRDAAYEAVKELGDQLGLGPVETALGIVKLSNQVMMRAIRLVSIERGHDPRMFTMFVFGGAGPLHAAELSEIGVEEVIIPPYPGVFSALGLLATDFRYEAVKSIVKEAAELDDDELNNIFIELTSYVVEKLIEDGVDKDRITTLRYLDIMYWGQAYHLTTPYMGSVREAIMEFHEMHEARYGYSMRDEPVAIVSARVEALGNMEKPSLPHSTMEEYRPRPVEERDVYYEDTGWAATPVYLRSSLKPGAILDGPSLITSDESTVLIPPEYHGYVDEYHAIHIRRGG
jgi:N-methylhydantoinase A